MRSNSIVRSVNKATPAHARCSRVGLRNIAKSILIRQRPGLGRRLNPCQPRFSRPCAVYRLRKRLGYWCSNRPISVRTSRRRSTSWAVAEIATAYTLAQDFVRMVREHTVDALADWIARAAASCVAELGSFANGLQRDLAAVTAGLSLAWSNGQVEGQINRLKLIKRTMYGRASFDLLRKRVLTPT